MIKPISILLCLLLLFGCKEDQPVVVTSSSVDTPKLDFDERVDVIAFGSCSKHNEKQPLWKSIAEDEPDLWIWTGDIIYADTENMNTFAKKYNQQLEHPAYQRFLERVPIFGIWDDHDYGVNNGGKEYPKKKEARDLLFHFLDVPENNPAWQREGAYQKYTLGQGDQTVKVILLDARYFRDQPRKTADGRSYLDSTGDILGEEQWQWLEEELMNTDSANLNVIVSGIQMIPEDHDYEKWANFPLSRERLFNLIKSSKTTTVLVSGDRHIGEISKINLGEQEVYEVTSSGMTHSWDSFPGEENLHRIGDVVSSLNYGELRIDWSVDPVVVSAEIRGVGSKVLQNIEFELE